MSAIELAEMTTERLKSFYRDWCDGASRRGLQRKYGVTKADFKRWLKAAKPRR